MSDSAGWPGKLGLRIGADNVVPGVSGAVATKAWLE